MAYISNKNQHLVPINFSPTGGLNLAVPAHAIQENEMQQANNVLYMPHSGQLVTRPGFSCLTFTPAPGAILNMEAFGSTIACSVDNGEVYIYDIPTDKFTSIHPLGATPIASFLVFNNKLLIADGAGLYSWDGTDVTPVTETLHPTALIEISNRVVINDKLDPDAVYFSAPEDEMDWDTTGAAVGLRAGYGDGMDVNGFAVLGTDLIVSKTGNGQKFLYRVNTAGDPKSWSVNKLITDTSADGELLIESVPNGVLYINEDAELRSLSGVQEYGDIRMANIGEKINPMLAAHANAGHPRSMIRYSPSYDILVIIFSGDIAFYHHASKRFTTMTFDKGDIRSVCDYNNNPLWGSGTGHIYTWNESSDSDEYEPTKAETFETNIKSKTYPFPTESLVKTENISFSNFVEGHGSVRINHQTVLDFDILGDPWYLFEADDTQLADANMPLADRSEADSMWKEYNRCRQKDFYIHVNVADGRLGLNYVELAVAMVAG